MLETIYLDTSIISAYFDERVLVRQAVTQAFWAQARNQYTMAISQVVLAEINRTETEALRARMLELVAPLETLELTQGAGQLAQRFLENEVVPPKKPEDALHLALAVERGFNYLVSWNFRHMVNVRVQKKLPLVSAQNGYFHQLSIVSPQAFIGSNEL